MADKIKNRIFKQTHDQKIAESFETMTKKLSETAEAIE